MLYNGSDQQLLLAARPPSRLHRRLAYGVMACLATAFCVTAPYASHQLPIVTAFIPSQAAIVIVNDLITAALILAQFWIVRWTWLLLLACGFLFSALLFVPFILTFPEVFAPTGLLGAGLQTASWLSISWHVASPLSLITALLVGGWREPSAPYPRSAGRAIAVSIALIIAIVCGLTWAILAYDEAMPRFFRNSFQFSQSIAPIILPIMALDAIAFLLLWRKGRSTLDLWLMVMCWTWLFEVSLGGLLAGSRYSLGWYAARIFQMGATFFVLLLLLSETTALYANMARAAIQRRGARQARQVAMDAMSASIGHEIRQPLTALLANADACALRLGRADPDLDEVRAALADIAAEGRRIDEIIGDARTMFMKSAHDRELLDINKVVRDVLATVDLDLRHQRVTVKADLGDGLPPVLADGGQLHQVFLNLIANAQEAMAAASGRLSLLTIRSSVVAGSSDIAVDVEDTGVGIADADSGRIFEPFFSTKAAGSGVGLTICKVIVEAHGGRLQVRANQPHGTIFRVVLPGGGYE